MGANRSHHFVPRCYLRNFSSRLNGSTINLFNIDRRLFIKDAPIKSQCAKPFLYGKDELEHFLSEVEGKYAQWITRGILDNPPSIVPYIENFIHFFLMIQYNRTEAAAAKTRAHFQLFDKLGEIGIEDPLSPHHFDISLSEMARFGTFMTMELAEAISDLQIIFLRNSSERRFVTCDDPVVATNRLYIQKMNMENFGVGNAGSIIYLPISPQVAIVAYDRDVYSCKKQTKYWCNISKTEEIDVFNDLIFLKAKGNIYFQSPKDFILSDFEKISSRRLNDWGKGVIAVPIGERDGGRVFKAVPEDERPENGGFLIHTSQRNPRPYRWPKSFPFRGTAHAYTNGSGVGYIRKNRMKSDFTDAVKIKV